MRPHGVLSDIPRIPGVVAPKLNLSARFHNRNCVFCSGDRLLVGSQAARAVHAPDKSARAARLASLVSHWVSKRPTALVEAAARTVEALTIHDGTHRRGVREPVGVVDVLVSGKAAEHRSAQQPGPQMARALAPATV